MTANMPATAVATFLRVTFRAVDGIVTRVVARAAGRVDLLDGLTSVAVDEVAYRKGQRYLTVCPRTPLRVGPRTGSRVGRVGVSCP